MALCAGWGWPEILAVGLGVYVRYSVFSTTKRGYSRARRGLGRLKAGGGRGRSRGGRVVVREPSLSEQRRMGVR